LKFISAEPRSAEQRRRERREKGSFLGGFQFIKLRRFAEGHDFFSASAL